MTTRKETAVHEWWANLPLDHMLSTRSLPMADVRELLEALREIDLEISAGPVQTLRLCHKCAGDPHFVTEIENAPSGALCTLCGTHEHVVDWPLGRGFGRGSLLVPPAEPRPPAKARRKLPVFMTCGTCKHWQRSAIPESFGSGLEGDELADATQRPCLRIAFVPHSGRERDAEPFLRDAEGVGARLLTPASFSCSLYAPKE